MGQNIVQKLSWPDFFTRLRHGFTHPIDYRLIFGGHMKIWRRRLNSAAQGSSS